MVHSNVWADIAIFQFNTLRVTLRVPVAVNGLTGFQNTEHTKIAVLVFESYSFVLSLTAESCIIFKHAHLSVWKVYWFLYSMRIDFFTNRIFREPNRKFDRTSFGCVRPDGTLVQPASRYPLEVLSNFWFGSWKSRWKKTTKYSLFRLNRNWLGSC